MRKGLLSILLAASLLVIGILLSVQVYSQQRAKKLVVDVVPDLNTFSFVDLDSSTTPTAGEPFIVEGEIFEEGIFEGGPMISLGTYLCRGFFIVVQADGDFTVVHQSFEIESRGTIHVEGNENGAVPGVIGFSRAIVGATGEFKGSGEASIEPMPNDPDVDPANPFMFRATFNFRD